MKTTRRVFLALLLALTFALGAQASDKHTAKGNYLVYVGTYTDKDSKGIYAYRFDAASGQVTSLGLAAETKNPSFVTIPPGSRFLYAVNEVGDYEGRSSGALSAFAIDKATGKLTFLNQVPSGGADPCWVAPDKTGKYLVVANYTGGSVAAFPLQEDGRLGAASAFVQHTGSGPKPNQEGPHAHSINLSPDNRFAVVADLGLDKLIVYRFDASKGSLTPNGNPGFTKLEPGVGPRHFAFHPNGKFAYVITEMGSAVTALSYDAAGGVLRQVQTISTLPKDFSGRNDSAEIQVHPSGKFLYSSNRGHDSIAVFAIDQRTGKLTLVEYAPTRGKEPRHFGIDPTGSYLFAANQHSGNIVVFRIDPATGRLTPTGRVLEVPSPVAVKFVPVQ